MLPRVPHAGAPKRPSLRSKSWTIAAILESAGPAMPKTEHSVSKVHPVTVMAALHSEHVKLHAVIRDGLPISCEAELGLTIDEEANKPGRRQCGLML